MIHISFCGIQSSDNHQSRKACIIHWSHWSLLTLIIIISRDILMRHSACIGFNLFTLTIKLRIYDSVHPFWELFEWRQRGLDGALLILYVQIGTSIFFCFLFLCFRWHVSFAVNSLLNAVFIFTLPYSTASHTRSSYIAHVFCRGSM